MTERGKRVIEWSGLIALAGLLLSITVAATRAGATAQKIEQKVDKADYERDIGQLKGDVRVIRAAVCQQSPGACR